MGLIQMKWTDMRYIVLRLALCDYLNALLDKWQGGTAKTEEEAKRMLAETCKRIIEGM